MKQQEENFDINDVCMTIEVEADVVEKLSDLWDD